MKRKGLLKKGLAVTLALTMVVPGGLSVSAEEVGQTETQETEPGVTEEDQIPEEGKNPEDVQETKEQEGVPSEEEKESSEKKEDVTEETSRDVQDLAESEEKEAAEGDEITAEDVVTMTKPDGTAVHYKSIQEAVTAVPDYDYKENKGMYTIQLQKDVSEDVKIPENKYIVMDLAGHKLTNVAGHTVTNCSMRTKISDTVGGGIVDNLTHGKGAVYNDVNASITLNGGMFTRSAEASTDGSSAGGNSWYVLKNYGEMTINKGVSVKFSDGNPGYFSSLIGNGWQNGAQAESGNNGEPKPSASKKKASLRIAGGTFTGGKIVVKNDDYGTLKISAGTFSQPTAGYYNILNNNTAEISGGSFEAEGTAVGSIHYDGGANNGDITVTGGTFTSAEEEALQLLGGAKGTVNGGTFTSIGSSAVSVEGGSSVTVTGGSFSARDKETAVIFMDDHASSKAQISGGSFKNTTQEHVANKENSFAEGYGPVDPDRDGTFEMGVVDAGAIVTEKDGTVTSYATLREAAKAAPEGSTVQLQRDAVLGQWGIETSQFGVTLDLNGHKIDGSAVTGNRGRAVYLHTSYGTTPSEGIDRIVRVINSSDQEAKISARIPVESSCGNSEYSLPVEIAENVSLEVLEGGTDAVKLGSSTYLIYTEKSAEYIKNGGFKAEAEGEVRIYGTYSSAASAAAGKTVEMLHDYTGSDTISSGSAGGVLDLGGHTYISQNPNEIVDLNYDNVDLTIKNGTLKSGQASLKQAGITMLYNKGSLTLDKVNLIVPGSSYGIVTNGTNKENKITLKDSVLDVSDGFGIYFPSSGSVKIENSVIKAKQCGVQICSGSLSVSGKDTEITVTGNPEPKTESDGAIIDGAAVSIIEREGYQDLGTINIKEGTFSSVSSSSPVKAYKFNNTDKTEQEWDEAGKYIEISGGTFSAAIPKNLCAEGFAPKENEDGSFTVEIEKKENAEAKIGESYYPTLQYAVKSASDGDTVVLLKDVTLSSAFLKINNSIILDLGNHKIENQLNNYGVVVMGGAKAVIKNGTIESHPSGTFAAVYIQQAELEIKDLTINAKRGFAVGNNQSSGIYWGKLAVEAGTVVNASETGIVAVGPYQDKDLPLAENAQLTRVEINGGKIEAAEAAITGNGNYHGTEIVVNGGELKNTKGDCAAVYHPQAGTLTLNGGTIVGGTGVQMCSGKLVVPENSTAKIQATSEDKRAEKTEGDGDILDGAAVSVVSREYPGGAPVVDIKGGAFNSAKGESVLDYKWKDKTASEWAEAGEYVEVAGGTFSSKVPGDLCAENYNPVEIKDADGNITYGVADEVKIDFLGGSLRMDYKNPDGSYDFTKTSLRFGYQIQLPEGAVLESWKWDYGTAADRLSQSVTGKNKVPQADGSFVSNLVLTDAPVDKYDTLVYTALSVTYKKDGQTITVTDKTESRSVKAVAEAIVNAPNATEAEKEYARGLLNAFNKNGWTGYY